MPTADLRALYYSLRNNDKDDRDIFDSLWLAYYIDQRIKDYEIAFSSNQGLLISLSQKSHINFSILLYENNTVLFWGVFDSSYYLKEEIIYKDDTISILGFYNNFTGYNGIFISRWNPAKDAAAIRCMIIVHYANINEEEIQNNIFYEIKSKPFFQQVSKYIFYRNFVSNNYFIYPLCVSCSAQGAIPVIYHPHNNFLYSYQIELEVPDQGNKGMVKINKEVKCDYFMVYGYTDGILVHEVLQYQNSNIPVSIRQYGAQDKISGQKSGSIDRYIKSIGSLIIGSEYYFDGYTQAITQDTSMSFIAFNKLKMDSVNVSNVIMKMAHSDITDLKCYNSLNIYYNTVSDKTQLILYNKIYPYIHTYKGLEVITQSGDTALEDAV